MNQTANTGTQHPTPASGSVAPKRARVKPEMGQPVPAATSAAPARTTPDNDPGMHAAAIDAIKGLNGRIPSGFDEVDILNLAIRLLAGYATLPPTQAHRAGVVRTAVAFALMRVKERANAKKAPKFVGPQPGDPDADRTSRKLIERSELQNWKETERLADLGDSIRRSIEVIGRDPALADTKRVVEAAIALDGAGIRVTQKAIGAETGFSQPTVSRRLEQAWDILEGMGP